MRWWDEHVVPRLVDTMLGNDEVGKLRTLACRGLSGRVLEVGFGSGLNVAHYPATVTAVTDVRVAALSEADFLGLVSEGPGLTYAMLDVHRGAIQPARG